MSLLPDINEKGQLILSKEDKKIITFGTIPNEKKKILKERMTQFKIEKDLEKLNNIDRPVADREPLIEESDE